MKNDYSKNEVDIWAGIECSFNRVEQNYMDQLHLSGHYERCDDIQRIAELGVKTLRYPVLWEKHEPGANAIIDWTYSTTRLTQLRDAGIQPIVGLVHHGSGPSHVGFYEGTFSEGLAKYAAKVAEEFPWVEYYTPVNEPLTTARFCGLYGHWYPHGRTTQKFLQILIEECKATVLAMQAIRKINPAAKLVQTEDLGKTHSTPKLKYQADFENHRRWLSIDLLCGRVTKQHILWRYFIKAGISKEDLKFFILNPCAPDLVGINHYVTSERYIDQRVKRYPNVAIGGNGKHLYVDIEAVRVGKNVGPKALLKEAWKRYKLPMAVTEVHLHCTREEQLRWFDTMWKAANELKQEGVDIRAITAWAVLGSFDWCTLLTKFKGCYEAGLFDVRSTKPRATALAKMVQSLAAGKPFHHPVMEEQGWWNRSCAILYKTDKQSKKPCVSMRTKTERPLIIIGKTGTLGKAFGRLCTLRGVHHLLLGREDVDIVSPKSMENIIDQYNPWGIINTAGYVRVDEAETDKEACFLANTTAPNVMAGVCQAKGIHFVTFSSDLVFDGRKNNPYLESDLVAPLNIYGQSKALAEEAVLKNNPSALIVRTSAFFGPWDQHNFVYHALNSFRNKQTFAAAEDVIISPTYVPDLVNTSLDLLLDEADGIWNISNKGSISWAMLAAEVAGRSGYNPKHFQAVPLSQLGFIAPRPTYSALTTEKGYELPSWEHALDRYLKEQELLTL
jgi:dTDP-4-dehydrorhamnose reductase